MTSNNDFNTTSNTTDIMAEKIRKLEEQNADLLERLRFTTDTSRLHILVHKQRIEKLETQQRNQLNREAMIRSMAATAAQSAQAVHVARLELQIREQHKYEIIRRDRENVYERMNGYLEQQVIELDRRLFLANTKLLHRRYTHDKEVKRLTRMVEERLADFGPRRLARKSKKNTARETMSQGTVADSRTLPILPLDLLPTPEVSEHDEPAEKFVWHERMVQVQGDWNGTPQSNHSDF